MKATNYLEQQEQAAAREHAALRWQCIELSNILGIHPIIPVNTPELRTRVRYLQSQAARRRQGEGSGARLTPIRGRDLK